MGGKAPSTHAANLLASLSEQMFKESSPARRMMFQQLTEALKTGGVGARIPIIQRAVADVNTATAQSSRSAGAMMSRAGLGGTPYAASTLAGIRASGAEAAAKIPTDIAQQLIAGGPGLVTSGSGIPGLSAAASLQQQAAASNQAMWGGIAGGAGQAAGTLGGSWLFGRGGGGGGAASPSTVNVPSFG